MRAFGLDLGTTSTVLAILEGGAPMVIPSAAGAELTPTAIGFSPGGETVVGERALALAEVHPEHAFVGFPKYLGTDWAARVDGRRLTAVDLTARFVEQLAADAQDWAGEGFSNVVAAIPSWFVTPQRFALRRALEEAGLTVDRILVTTEAVALAYEAINPSVVPGDPLSGESDLLVFAIRGEGLDLGVFYNSDGVVETKALRGVRGVGGEALDAAAAGLLADRFLARTGIDVLAVPQGSARLISAARRARNDLASNAVSSVQIPYLTTGPLGPVHLEDQLSQQDLETATSEIAARCADAVAGVLQDAVERASRLSCVLLVGEAARLPSIAADLAALAPQARVRAWAPATACALGLALQAAILKGEVKDLLPLQALPHAFGIATKGGILTPILHRHTTIPTKEKLIVTTAEDNQPSVMIQVFEGEAGPVRDATALGDVELTGIPPAPRGVPQIEVEFDVDANSVLHMSARDLATGRQVELAPRGQPAAMPAPSSPAVTGTGGVSQGPSTPDEPDEPQFFLLLN